jgi:hypothetical protein
MMAAVTVRTTRAPYAGWRALAATVLVMSAATGAHTWAGGHLPAWPGLVLLGAVVLGASRLVLGGSAPGRLLLPAVAAAQALLHTSFVATSGHGAHVAAQGPSPWSGRMLLAHASVSLLTLLVWRLCERAALTVLRLLALPSSYVEGRVVRRPVAPVAGSHVSAAVLLLAAPRRGPPVVPGPA